MDLKKQIIHKFLGPPSREIKYLQGREKTVVDATLAAAAAEKNLETIIRNRMSPIEIINTLDSQVSIATGFEHSKYVYYDGHVFLDCFAPRWPGGVMETGMETLIRNMAREYEDWKPYIPSVVFSITKKCIYRCEHCYASHTLGGREKMTVEDMVRIAHEFQDIGVGVMAWEGGDPLMRFDDLLTLIRETRDRSDQMIATTAYGLTPEMAGELHDAGLNAAIISLDHYEPDKHNDFRRNPKAFDMAVNGVRIFRENGILPSIAICAVKEIFENDGLFKYLELAKEIGAAFVQVLDATPSGNYLGKNVMLSKSQMEEIKNFQRTANTDPRYRDYPSVQARAYLEDESLYGCGAANALVYIDSDGHMQGCDLLQISFGNVMEEGVGPVFKRMKGYLPHSTKGRCPAQTLTKQIEKVYRDTGELPISYNDAENILETMISRGLPDHFERIKKKRERRRLKDFFESD